MDSPQLVIELVNNQLVKFGNFTLKSGAKSSVYINLRGLYSYPVLMNNICDMIYDKIRQYKFDLICGVPDTGFAIASNISARYGLPMILKKKEQKSYGMANIIDGEYKRGDRCILVDDLITNGKSKREVMDVLIENGIDVIAVAVFIDRSDAGIYVIDNSPVLSCLRFDELIHIYQKFLTEVNRQVMIGNNANNVTNNTKVSNASNALNSANTKRSSNVQSELIIKNRKIESGFTITSTLLPMNTSGKLITKQDLLWEIIYMKKTNVALSADVNNKWKLLELADHVGPHICMLKLHIDIVEDLDKTFMMALRETATKHNFMILIDRKFADIGNTVSHQLHHGTFHISDYADLVTVHTVMGEGTIQGLIQPVNGKNTPGLLLLAQASSKDNLITPEYTAKTCDLADRYSDNVCGFICQGAMKTQKKFIHFTPGVNLATTGDNLGQQYNTPEAVVSRGSDVLIVGRGIYEAKDPVEAAITYKTAGYESLLKRGK